MNRLLNLLLPGVLMALAVGVCRWAAGGEGAPAPSGAGDPNLWRLLDYGALGMFTIYLIWDRKQRDKKDVATATRFEAMDKEIVGVTRDAAVAMNVMANAATTMTASVDELKRMLYTKPCLRPQNARTRDTDG